MTSLPSRSLLRASLALLPFLGLVIAGCKSDEIVDPPPGTAVTIPKSGSTFSLLSYDVDNGVKVAGTERTTTATVTATDGSFHGRQNVVVFTAPNGTEPLLMIYEPNGDLSVVTTYSNGGSIFQFTMPPRWTTIPFGSKVGGMLVSYDTAAERNGVTGGVTYRRSAGYLGSEEMTLGGEKLMTYKVRITTNWTATHEPSSGSETVKEESTYWYAPKIGFFVRIEGERRSDRTPAFVAWHTELTGYTLK